MKLYAEYQKYNMFRLPTWRWDRVLRLCEKSGRCTSRDDNYIKTGREFLQKWRNRSGERRQELFYEYPGLFYAHEAHLRGLEDPSQVLLLEARLLTRMSYKEIADACDTIPDTVEWYEALFFNVRDKLKARDWITSRVLVPAMVRNFGLLDAPHHAAPSSAADDDEDDSPQQQQPGPWSDRVIARPFLDASLKMFAYFGGPILCEFMIHGFQAGKILSTSDNLTQFLDEHWALTLRARSTQAARTFQINKYNVMELFQTHARILEIEKSEDSMDQKRSTIERHVSALMDEIPWNVGDAGEEHFAGTKVITYDNSAGELRDDELHLVAAGHKVKSTDGLELLRLPPPSATPKPPSAEGGSK